MQHFTLANPIRLSGFSMIEVLVSIFVICIGVIGAAAMQATALRTAQQSGLHTVALHVANDLADKIRAASALESNMADNPYVDIDFDSAKDVAELDTACYGSKATCSDKELAPFELYEIKRKVKNHLPGGRLKICRDESPWDDVADRFQWNCTSSDMRAAIVVKLGWREQRTRVPDREAADHESGPQLVLSVGV